MPSEVIDLLSSSSPPAPRRRKTPAKTTPPNKQQPSKSANAPPKTDNGASYFALSPSDEEDNSKSNLPSMGLPPKVPANTSTAPPSNPKVITIPSQPLQSSWSFEGEFLQSIGAVKDDCFFHSDDFDTTVNLDKSVSAPPARAAILGLDRKRMDKERLDRINKMNNGGGDGEVSTTVRNGEDGVEQTVKPASAVSTKKAKPRVDSVLQDLDSHGPFDFDQSLPDIDSIYPTRLPPPFKRTVGNSSSNPRGLSKRKAAVSIISSDDDPFASDDAPPMKRQKSPKLHTKLTVSKSSGLKRSISNIETTTKPAKPKASGLPSFKSTIIESDPILFTSSPDYVAEAARKKKAKAMPTLEEDDNFGLSSPPKIERTAMDISIDNNSESLSDIDAIAVGIAATKTKASSHKSSYKSTDALEKYKADKEKDKKAQGKAREKEEKTREKDAEKERKRIAKEERARYKESATFLAEANKLKTDKKISTPEMIVVLPSSLENKLKDAILVFMLELSVKTEEYQSTLPVVKWKRKTEAEWDPEAQYFRPCELKIIEEKHIIYVMAAKEFVQLATGEEGNDLDCHVLRLKTKYEDCQIIYLIEGLAKWQKKNKDIKNKAYTDAVRSHLSAAETSTSSSERAKKKYEVYVDDDVIERELLKLQVIHGVLIHHSVVAENTPEWIRSFTQHISTIPYKMQQRSMDTSFCMEQGQVKAGTDTKDTFIKMLGEITRITSPIALGISNKFPTVQKLVKGLKEEGPLALMELRTMANRDGAYADRRIGKAISRRVHTVFTSRDEWREDV